MKSFAALMLSLMLTLGTLSTAAAADEHSASSAGPGTAQDERRMASRGRDDLRGESAPAADGRAAAVDVAQCKKNLTKKYKKLLKKKLKKSGTSKKSRKQIKKKLKRKLKRQIARKCKPTPVTPTLPGFPQRSDYLGDSPFAPYATAEFSELRTGPRSVVLRHGDTSFELYGDLQEDSTWHSISLTDGVQTIEDVAFDPQQELNSPAGVAVLYAVRTAPSGLNPETYAVVLDVVDGHGTTVVHTTIPTTVGARDGVALSVALLGAVAVVSLENDEQQEFFGIDVPSGTVRWSDTTCFDGDEEIDADSVGRILRVCEGNRYEAVDAATGAVLWSKETDQDDLWGLVSPQPTVQDTYPGYFVLRYNYGSSMLLSSADGVIVATDEWRVDYRTGFLATDEGGLRIIDLATRAPVLQAPVGVLPVGAYDRRLWFWNEGPDVIDMTTGARDALAPAKKSGYQHSDNVPKLSGAMWVILGDTNGYGENEFDLVLYRDTRTPITAEELPRTVITGIS